MWSFKKEMKKACKGPDKVATGMEEERETLLEENVRGGTPVKADKERGKILRMGNSVLTEKKNKRQKEATLLATLRKATTGIVRLTSPADRNDSWTINLNDFSIAGARSSVFAKMERNEPSSFEVYGTFQGPPKQHFRVRLEEKHGTLVAGMTLGLGIQSGDAVPYHVTAPKKMESI
ncbi:hypothetical protein pclt_cds_953 [Pandoravirus celtis]|uniref:Uncharacterized protein n=1 Tax=Pandoravirus celtis TaxID=2568002 RepID=A0A4D6EK46_9VIRU|nr:hypothetical protein pclt_cds_953 [Pandoravirus celtis]